MEDEEDGDEDEDEEKEVVEEEEVKRQRKKRGAKELRLKQEEDMQTYASIPLRSSSCSHLLLIFLRSGQ